MYRFLPSDNVLNVSLRFGFSSREPYLVIPKMVA